MIELREICLDVQERADLDTVLERR